MSINNKEFFETDYRRGRAIVVFRGFILTFEVKNENSVF